MSTFLRLVICLLGAALVLKGLAWASWAVLVWGLAGMATVHWCVSARQTRLDGQMTLDGVLAQQTQSVFGSGEGAKPREFSKSVPLWADIPRQYVEGFDVVAYGQVTGLAGGHGLKGYDVAGEDGCDRCAVRQRRQDDASMRRARLREEQGSVFDITGFQPYSGRLLDRGDMIEPPFMTEGVGGVFRYRYL